MEERLHLICDMQIHVTVERIWALGSRTQHLVQILPYYYELCVLIGSIPSQCLLSHL